MCVCMDDWIDVFIYACKYMEFFFSVPAGAEGSLRGVLWRDGCERVLAGPGQESRHAGGRGRGGVPPRLHGRHEGGGAGCLGTPPSLVSKLNKGFCVAVDPWLTIGSRWKLLFSRFRGRHHSLMQLMLLLDNLSCCHLYYNARLGNIF